MPLPQMLLVMILPPEAIRARSVTPRKTTSMRLCTRMSALKLGTSVVSTCAVVDATDEVAGSEPCKNMLQEGGGKGNRNLLYGSSGLGVSDKGCWNWCGAESLLAWSLLSLELLTVLHLLRERQELSVLDWLV